jgi:hypothetical protein
LKQLKVAISTKASIPSGVKSTKFVKQILSTYATIVVISGFAKQFAECLLKKQLQGVFNHYTIAKFYIQNGKVGEG